MRALAIVGLLLAALPASAQDWTRVSYVDDLTATVVGKTLTHRIFDISVIIASNGGITGGALGWDVTGSWTWERGFFCRDLFWGGDDMGYNCQLVETQGDLVRFTSDQGAGRSAVLRIQD